MTNLSWTYFHDCEAKSGWEAWVRGQRDCTLKDTVCTPMSEVAWSSPGARASFTSELSNGWSPVACDVDANECEVHVQ